MLVATVITKRQNLNRGSDMERNEFFIRVSMGGYEMVECEDLVPLALVVGAELLLSFVRFYSYYINSNRRQ